VSDKRGNEQKQQTERKANKSAKARSTTITERLYFTAKTINKLK
jgi:hypothetical protein